MNTESTVTKGPASNGHEPRLVTAPPVDVYENGDEYLVTADVPGPVAGSVQVELEHDRLSIFARAEATGEGKAARRGREYQRTFRVPDGIDGGAITALLKEGVLTVRLPKSAALKPRVIPVRSS